MRYVCISSIPSEPHGRNAQQNALLRMASALGGGGHVAALRGVASTQRHRGAVCLGVPVNCISSSYIIERTHLYIICTYIYVYI